MPPETFQHAPAEAENQMCERSGLIIPKLVDTERKRGRKKRRMYEIPVREVIFLMGPCTGQRIGYHRPARAWFVHLAAGGPLGR